MCWDPQREGFLAYGTEDGKAGVFEVRVAQGYRLRGCSGQVIGTGIEGQRVEAFLLCWMPARTQEP